MAFATITVPRHVDASVQSHQAHGWSRQLLHLLIAAGATIVVAGSYSTWATFYAGLVARNGVAGHGKFFTGLAVAAVLASLLTSVRGVWDGLRWLAVPAGLTIALFALRDLRNLDALIRDPAAGFYLPGRGNGLFVTTAGALVLMLAPFARPFAANGPSVDWTRTAIATALVGSVAMLVPGLYGEYYLRVAPEAHAHGSVGVLNTAHLLTAAGAILLVVASHAAVLITARGGAMSSDRVRARRAPTS